MKPFHTLAQTQTPDGATLALHEHDKHFYLKLNGRQLMSSFSCASEILLAELACNPISGIPDARILIGGLGLGITLKRSLEILGREAQIDVAELIPQVVDWNREFLGGLNGRAVEDKRVTILVDDVFKVIGRAKRGTYDAILLDVDNGPVSMVGDHNSRIYDRYGLGRIARSLQPDGRALFWSASEDRSFVDRLARTGYKVHAVQAKSHETARQTPHRIYIATRVIAPVQPEPAQPRKVGPPKVHRDRKNRT